METPRITTLVLRGVTPPFHPGERNITAEGSVPPPGIHPLQELTGELGKAGFGIRKNRMRHLTNNRPPSGGRERNKDAVPPTFCFGFFILRFKEFHPGSPRPTG